MFHSGTTTAAGYKNLLLQLKQLATSQHLASVDSVAAAGTGYNVGDVLDIVGGTGTHVATIKVLTLTGGAGTGVATAEVVNGGAYTSPPTDPVGVTGPGNDDATFNLTFANTGWTTQRHLVQIGLTAVTLIVNDGTSGTYAVNDILTVSGGTFTTAATLRVTAASGGAITGIAVETAGEYTVAPSNPVSVTGGGGSGATFNLAFNGVVSEDELILMGEGGGSDEIFVGARTYSVAGPGAKNWELAGFTGYTAANPWTTQPGISPGRYEAASTDGAYVPLRAAAMTYWACISTRRIVMVVEASTNYASLHMGWLNQFGTAAEFPYPLYIAGSTSKYDEVFSSSDISFSGIADPVGGALSSTGPGLFRNTAGVWSSVKNSYDTGAGRTAHIDFNVYPTGAIGNSPSGGNPLINDADEIVADGPVPWVSIIPNSGVPGTELSRLQPTPNGSGTVSPLWPCTLVVQHATLGSGVMGEMHNVYWISAANSPTIVSKDTVTYLGKTYIVFKSGARGEIFTHFAIKVE